MSRAAATRWLADRVGQQVSTKQVIASNGRTWEPGVRTIARRGKVTFTLDGSEVRITSSHVPLSITSTALVVEWRDERGSLIHTTTYEVTA